MAAATVSERPGPGFPYRMKDLCDRTGLPRQVIHFYIQQGLLPEGHKTGRNMAYYGEAHVERIKLIKQLQNERFLPLKAIRAVLDEQEDAFTPEQRRLLLDVKRLLAPRLGSHAPPGDAAPTTELHQLLLKTGVSKEDAADMERLGLLTTTKRKGKTCVGQEQAWIIEVWGEMRRLGFTRALGFQPEDMLVFVDGLTAMFQREVTLIKERLAHLPPDQVAPMVERSIPIINTFLARYHESLIRSLFASVQA